MRKYNSRRTNLEEKKNVKKAFTFIILSILTLLFLFFFGIPLIAKFVSFITDFAKKDSPITINDNTPPAPPRLNNLPDATNKSEIDITGNTEEGVIVYIYVNNQENEIVADSYGEFVYSTNLENGDNIIYATAKDQSGNKSSESERQVVIFDNESPNITINSPKDNANFYGSSQKEIEVSGNTDSKSSLTVNDRYVPLDDEGNFKTKYSLSDGENTLVFKAIDKAQNETDKTIKVTFNP